MEKAFVVGIDIGGTNTIIGLVNSQGGIEKSASYKTQEIKNVHSYIQVMAQKIKEVTEGLLPEQFKGIGIGAPNGNYYNGSIEFAPNLPWEGVIPFVKLLGEYFPGKRIELTNDANAAAIGEMIFGNAKGLTDFIMITLGTGVGSGIVAGGKLIYGHDGFAGEIGHTIYDFNGRPCGCGRKGCLETYTSASGMVKTALELLNQSSEKSPLRDINPQDLSPKILHEMAEKGDPIALQTFEITGKILGQKLSDSVAHTSPSHIILFGGITKSGDLLMRPLKKYLNESLLKIYQNKVEILFSALPESDAAILGAAALIEQ